MGKPYDPSIRTSEEGQALYQSWRRARRYPHCEEWENYVDFHAWAMETGYVQGAWLRLKDKSKPYCPENCIWYSPGTYAKSEDPEAWIENWNKTVNKLRKQWKMPPLEGTEYVD